MKKINENIKSGNFELSKGHQPFMKVPKGGSSCANCKFLSEDKLHCVQQDFINWNETSLLPQPIDEYCSDWYEPSEEYLAKGGNITFNKYKKEYNGDGSVFRPFDLRMEFPELVYNNFPTQKQIEKLNKWLRDNKDKYVQMYHGTPFENKQRILEKGILPTTYSRRHSQQSESGYVYLSVFPTMSKVFADMANVYSKEKNVVFVATIQIMDLKPDTDQLKNKRIHGQDLSIGDTLAESIIYGHGARVKGKVDRNVIRWIDESDTEYFKHGGTLYNGIKVPKTVNPRMVISAFANPIDESKVEEYTEKMRDMMLSHDFPPITGFPTVIDESDVGDYFLSGDEITEEHIGKQAWKVWDGHHRTLAAINANLPYIEVELEKAAVTDMDEYLENGGKLKCDFDKETKSCSNACNMENGGQIKSFKSPNDLVALRYFDGNEELGHLVYYASNESISIGLNEDPYNFKNEMYIEFLEVKEEHRGKGIAKKLLNRAIQDAKELGIEVITLRRDSGLGCNYGSDYDNYLKKIYSSVGFVQTWTQKEFEESNGEKNICAMHLVVSESKFNSGGQLPSIIKYARIKPIREGGEERVVRVSPDSVGGFVAGYVIYYPAKSNNKVAYFNKSDFQNLLDDGSYTLFNTIEQAQSSKPMEIDIEEQLKIRQRMRSLLKLLKYKTTDETGMTKEDRFIDRVVQLIYDGKDFKSKLDIERIAENEFEFEDKRKVRELTEYAVLSVGREISKVYGNDVTVAYKKMVSLYSNQPYSTHRTGTSVNLGQFSTPLPMSYLMGCYVGINIPSDKVYFEPTGGNGSLTVAGNVEDFVINELDMHRYNNLLKENYKLVLNQDATKKFDFDFKFDGMLANPPFATTKTDIIVGGFHISGLEQQIIVNSLMYLKDKAKTAFIIGGHTEFDEEGRIKSKKDRAFLSYLFKHYYMDDVININGSLYGRQGTTYPIRIILLAAKKSEPSGFYPLRNEALGKFEPFSVKVIDTFDELFKRTEKYIQKSL